MRGESWLAAAILAAFAAACVHTATRLSPTFDEPLHLVAGLALWELGDHRFGFEQGPVPRRAMALPAWLAGAALPPLQGAEWRRAADAGMPFAVEFVKAAGGALPRYVLLARLVNVAVATLLAAAVWRWARRIYGPRGGIAALACFAVCPTALAHGSLATTDIWAALGFVLATRAWDKLLARPSWRALAASAAATSFLFVVKLSAPLFLGVAAALAAWRSFGAAPPSRKALFGWSAFHALAVWLALWAAYGGRYSMFAPAHAAGAEPTEAWEDLLPPTGLKRQAVEWVRAQRLLPEAYIHGALLAARHSRERATYLCGLYSETRFTAYFPLAFLLKTPPLAVVALAAGAAWWLRGGGWRRAAAPAMLAFVYGATATFAAPNIGVRHLLPAFAAAHVLLGGLAERRWGRRLLGLAFAAGLAECAANHPHHLAYFTPAVGGWREGHRYLSDSNLDWGQDLEAAAAWLREPSALPRYALLFGTAQIEGYGTAARPPFVAQLTPRGLDPAADYGGEYLISATSLRSPARSSPAALAEAAARGAFAARALAGTGNLPAAQRAELMDLALDGAEAGLRRHCANRRPDGYVGHSLLLFRLTDAEAKEFLFGPPP